MYGILRVDLINSKNGSLLNCLLKGVNIFRSQNPL